MKIAVFCPNLIGDTVMATPTFRALRGQFPDARFTAIIRPHVAPVLDGSHWFDKTILFHHRSDRREQRTHAVANLLRQMRNDVAILLPNSFRAAWVAWMAGIPRRIGYVRYGRGMLLTDGLKPPRDPTGKLLPIPIVEYYLALARVLGCRGSSIQLELATTPSDESAADRAWNQLGLAADERLVCLNTGGDFRSRQKLACRLFRRAGSPSHEGNRRRGSRPLRARRARSGGRDRPPGRSPARGQPVGAAAESGAVKSLRAESGALDHHRFRASPFRGGISDPCHHAVRPHPHCLDANLASPRPAPASPGALRALSEARLSGRTSPLHARADPRSCSASYA